MWRFTRLARNVFLRGGPKFRAPHNTCDSQVLKSHEPLLSSSCTPRVSLKSPFSGNPRFFSANPDPYSEDIFNDGAVSVDPGLESVVSEKADDLSGNFNGLDSGNDDKVGNMVRKMEKLLSLLQGGTGNEKSLESKLEDLDLVLDEEFVLKVFQTPCLLGENLIGFVRWVYKKSEGLVTKKAVDALVIAISNELKVRNVYALWDLVKDARGKDTGIVSTETLNDLLSLFSSLGKGKVAYEVFNKFEDFGCEPNADTYFFTIDTLGKRKIYYWASSVCERMICADKLPRSEQIGKIITHLCKGKKLKDAHMVYMWAKDRKVYPSQSSVNLLISSLCGKNKMDVEDKKGAEDETHSPSQLEVVSQEENGNIYLALSMLEDFPKKERVHAIKPFSSIVEVLCRIRDFEGVKKLLFQMIESGPPPGNTIFNTIITGLSKAGEMEEALMMLKIMEGRGLKPDVYSYTVIISGYVAGGAMEEACKVLDEAKEKHSKLSPVTYHSMIRGYCKLEQFEEALKLVEEMKSSGVKRNAYVYDNLIKSLCTRALDWKTSLKLLKEMQESGLQLNEKTMSLIRAVKELQEEMIESGAVKELQEEMIESGPVETTLS